MTKTNMAANRVPASTPGLMRAEVLRSTRLSHSFQRVTLAGGTLNEFVSLGFDQWFRLFIPSAQGNLERVPQKLDTLSYLKYLTLPKGTRPIIRNYTVAQFRSTGVSGPELDVDFVLHAAADGSMGPAAQWSLDCVPGDRVALIDEGLGFRCPQGISRVNIVADETGLPAAAGVLASLPKNTAGMAILEVPEARDIRDLSVPAGIEVHWLPRTGGPESPTARDSRPGDLALEFLKRQAPETEEFYGWAVGESGLVTSARRHWVASGVPKSNISFCGYWKQQLRH